MIIGICGKSGSGKSTLAKEIINKYKDNAIHLDIDKIGHKVLTYEEVKKELIESFGKQVISDDTVDRKKLGQLVFNSRKEMDKLSDITWEYMQKEIDKVIEINKDKVIILDWLLLPTTKYFELCDLKILLDVPYEIRMKRAMLRDNISEEAFALREKASIQFDNAKFDFVMNENSERERKELVIKI